MPVRKALSLAVLSLFLLSGVPGAFSQAALQTGSYMGGASDQNGTSSFTVQYSYSPQIVGPQKYNISMILNVNSLTGQRLNVYTFGYAVQIYWSTGLDTQGHYQYNVVKYLYPGAHSPVANVTIPLNDSDIGIQPGAKATGTITVNTVIQVYYGPPVNFYFADTIPQQTLGNVTFSDKATTTTSTTATTSGGGTAPQQGSRTIYTFLGAGIIVVAVVAGVAYSLMQRSKAPRPVAAGGGPGDSKPAQSGNG